MSICLSWQQLRHSNCLRHTALLDGWSSRPSNNRSHELNADIQSFWDVNVWMNDLAGEKYQMSLLNHCWGTLIPCFEHFSLPKLAANTKWPVAMRKRCFRLDSPHQTWSHWRHMFAPLLGCVLTARRTCYASSEWSWASWNPQRSHFSWA